MGEVPGLGRLAPELADALTLAGLPVEGRYLLDLGALSAGQAQGLGDLRLEGITRLFEAGLAIEEVALISGHQSWAMLKRYPHIKLENVLEKLK